MGLGLFSMLSWICWAALLVRISLEQDSVGAAIFTKGQKIQMILSGVPDISKMPLPPTDAPVWDIDLFDSDATTVSTLKAAGKIVICYFSAGTYEDWRDDAKSFPSADIGKALKEWPDEKWIRTSSTAIRSIMQKRIQLASSKGCDAIDPDNIDGYQNDNGLNLKNTDAINYVQWLQQTAAQYNMQVGLKNSIDILSSVSNITAFAVNEQCASPNFNECSGYADFLASGKPVFHVEYPSPLNTSAAKSVFCTAPGTAGMSTFLAELALNGHTIYCDGSEVNTPTKGGTRPSRSVGPRPTTSRTPIPPPTVRPTNPPTTRVSSARPTSTPSNPGGGGGCKSKHWDQCGGQNWNGCTTCESPYTCKGVSPPYYYQCL